MRDYPKYVVSFQTEFDNENMTPLQAGVAALAEMRSSEAAVSVYDVDTKRHWDVRFRDHELEIMEFYEMVWKDGTFVRKEEK
jgi:hypothetical protein